MKELLEGPNALAKQDLNLLTQIATPSTLGRVSSYKYPSESHSTISGLFVPTMSLGQTRISGPQIGNETYPLAIRPDPCREQGGGTSV
jgi:hypothetical protein